MSNIVDIEYFIEEWDQENYFCYINDKQYEMCESDFSAFVVSNSVKAKFRFPSKDPVPNLIEDTRSDSQKVSDILRIWSQILTPDEIK